MEGAERVNVCGFILIIIFIFVVLFLVDVYTMQFSLFEVDFSVRTWSILENPQNVKYGIFRKRREFQTTVRHTFTVIRARFFIFYLKKKKKNW